MTTIVLKNVRHDTHTKVELLKFGYITKAQWDTALDELCPSGCCLSPFAYQDDNDAFVYFNHPVAHGHMFKVNAIARSVFAP